MSRPYIPQTLTPVEAAAEGMIRAEKRVREMNDESLAKRIEGLRAAKRLVAGERYQDARRKLSRELAEFEAELLRRRRVV